MKTKKRSDKMGYPWQCSDCIWLDMKDSSWRGFRCTKKGIYVNPEERSCNNHFEKKNESSSTCYLTTAMCEILNEPDNCYVLETLRSFRDNVMKNDENCTPLLEEYDVIGPQICKKLYQDEQKEVIARSMLYLRIYPAINAIKNEKYDDAIEIYKDMTELLKEKYNVKYECTKTTTQHKTKKLNLQY